MDIPLGKHTTYPEHYDPGVLFPVSRQASREALGISGSLPFFGYDHWRAYELSWLNSHGVPQVAMADIIVPCSSANLVESKSMKLYFNSLNQHRFESLDDFCTCVRGDLSAVAGADVAVQVYNLGDCPDKLVAQPEQVQLLDAVAIEDPGFELDASVLRVVAEHQINTTYVSHLFRSNCPVTSQPDWGSIVINYTGPEPDQAALLRYILSYRMHEGFHESCVEQIFVDLVAALKPSNLTVSINFTRRGGLEINPVRSTQPFAGLKPLPRFVRQ